MLTELMLDKRDRLMMEKNDVNLAYVDILCRHKI
jgi:hypothetical protein